MTFPESVCADATERQNSSRPSDIRPRVEAVADAEARVRVINVDGEIIRAEIQAARRVPLWMRKSALLAGTPAAQIQHAARVDLHRAAAALDAVAKRQRPAAGADHNRSWSGARRHRAEAKESRRSPLFVRPGPVKVPPPSCRTPLLATELEAVKLRPARIRSAPELVVSLLSRVALDGTRAEDTARAAQRDVRLIGDDARASRRQIEDGVGKHPPDAGSQRGAGVLRHVLVREKVPEFDIDCPGVVEGDAGVDGAGRPRA